MNGRTLLPLMNDTWGQWLDRLIHGTQWETRQVQFVCFPNEHVFTVERPWAPNDSTATNFQTLIFYERRWLCPECGSEFTSSTL